MNRGVSRNSSDPNLLDPSLIGARNNNRKASRKNNRSVNGGRAG